MSLYARLIALAVIALGLSAGAWKCYTAGQNNVRAQWTADKLATSEAARLKEKDLNLSTERIDRDYQNTKARRAADKRITDDRLRNFAAAAGASADTTATCGVDDPYRDIARECAAALADLDGYAQQLAGKTSALQRYTSEVCVAP